MLAQQQDDNNSANFNEKIIEQGLSAPYGEVEDSDNFSRDKALLRKLDWKLLPALTLLYLLSFLDRSNGLPIPSSLTC